VVLQLEGSLEQWEAYWRRLGSGGCSPEGWRENGDKNLLALWPRQSDESSCATSAQKESAMTNAESSGTARAGATGANAATQAAGDGQQATGGSAAPQGRKRTASRPKTSGGAARGQGQAKPAPRRAPAKKPRAESKGAQILELIGRAKGATLAEILQATSWQAHSVRGFLSAAGKRYQWKITSLRNDAGERVYKLER
jgi:hypothetical protein